MRYIKVNWNDSTNVIDEDGMIDGIIGGDVTVLPGVFVCCKGITEGVITAREGSRLIIIGITKGTVIAEAGAQVMVSGILTGTVENRGGFVVCGDRGPSGRYRNFGPGGVLRIGDEIVPEGGEVEGDPFQGGD